MFYHLQNGLYLYRYHYRRRGKIVHFVFQALGIPEKYEMLFYLMFFVAMAAYGIAKYIKSEKYWKRKSTEHILNKSVSDDVPVVGHDFFEKKTFALNGKDLSDNSEAAEFYLKLFFPNFYAKRFVIRAEELVKKMCEVRDVDNMTEFVAKNVKISNIPISVMEFKDVFIHNLLIKDKRLSLELYMKILTGDRYDSYEDEYFIEFTCEMPALTVQHGQFALVTCKTCCGEFDLNEDNMKKCPFCGALSRFEESKWYITEVQRIDAQTYIDNRAVIKSY